jgi:hypothetical protein
MMGFFRDWFLTNWVVVISILLSVVAISFTALKDFVLPWIIRPKLKLSYLPNSPYKRQAVLTGSRFFVFEKFKITNTGKAIAKNCRCQIFQIKKNRGLDRDLQGFPLRWASFPDKIGSFEKNERLNIGPGESEFVDLLHMRDDDTTKIFLSSHDSSVMGKGDDIEIGDYIIQVIISGDNFKPYIADFKIERMPQLDGFKIKLLKFRRK